MTTPKSDIEIARAAKMRPIQEIGERLGIRSEHLIPFGHTKAKLSLELQRAIRARGFVYQSGLWVSSRFRTHFAFLWEGRQSVEPE